MHAIQLHEESNCLVSLNLNCITNQPVVIGEFKKVLHTSCVNTRHV